MTGNIIVNPNRDDTVFFTGHRPRSLAGYDTAGYAELKQFLKQYLEKQILPRKHTFLTGGAQGFDQIAFGCVNHLKTSHPEIKNFVIAPFPGQESLWRYDGIFGQAAYRNMLKQSDGVAYTKIMKPATKRGIVEALMQRNTDMMTNASVCIGLCQENWQDPQTSSGTADALRKAKAAGLEIHVIRYQITNGYVSPTGVDVF